ncbi:intracellular sulfur oxidation DsrE/DsrF family protein [Pseudarthrobacter sulfonivorans]|nr:intracellular sulfur oxidation DsrE/DsrF family protein [Pseudarthrobacter sulfonivorans]
MSVNEDRGTLMPGTTIEVVAQGQLGVEVPACANSMRSAELEEEDLTATLRPRNGCVYEELALAKPRPKRADEAPLRRATPSSAILSKH